MSALAPIEAHQEIVQGSDYKAAEGDALTWTNPEWPNLASATLKMVVGHSGLNLSGLEVSWEGKIGATPTPNYVAALELTHEQTKLVPEGCFDYVLFATLADTDVVALAYGKLTVQAEPGSSVGPISAP